MSQLDVLQVYVGLSLNVQDFAVGFYTYASLAVLVLCPGTASQTRPLTIILVISMFKSHLAARQNVPLTTIKLKLKVGQRDNRAWIQINSEWNIFFPYSA